MKIGDKVKWTSQSSGTVKEKEGTIVAVVPSFFRINKSYLGRIAKEHNASARFLSSSSYPTAYDRYLVLVGNGNKKPLLCFPNRNFLSIVDGG